PPPGCDSGTCISGAPGGGSGEASNCVSPPWMFCGASHAVAWIATALAAITGSESSMSRMGGPLIYDADEPAHRLRCRQIPTAADRRVDRLRGEVTEAAEREEDAVLQHREEAADLRRVVVERAVLGLVVEL